MSLLQTRLGYGQVGVVELDQFTRILKEEFYDDEEVRCDKPATWSNTYEYIAVAPSGSSTSIPIWNCVRKTWISNRCIRIQYQANVVWDNRSQGWPI